MTEERLMKKMKDIFSNLLLMQDVSFGCWDLSAFGGDFILGQWMEIFTFQGMVTQQFS